MRFSILIPVYNVEKYLSQCLDSVVNQSFDDYEIIVIDDGSTDKSSLICDDYQARFPDRITVIHKANQGLIAARRDAIDRANGEFCVFVDSDDFVETNLLDTINRYLLKDEDIDMVLFSFSYYTEGVKIERNKHVADDFEVWRGDNKKILYELLATGDSIDSLVTKAIKTVILKQDPIDYKKYYSKNMSEDVLQSIYPITFAEKIIYADVSLYNYRYNYESISRSFSPVNIIKKDSSHVFNEIFSVLHLWKLNDENFKQRIYARWFSDVLYIFNKSCQHANNLKTWREIFNTNWNIMLPNVSIAHFQKYVNPFYIELYSDYINKRFIKIFIRFKFNGFIKKIRLMKSKFISKLKSY